MDLTLRRRSNSGSGLGFRRGADFFNFFNSTFRTTNKLPHFSPVRPNRPSCLWGDGGGVELAIPASVAYSSHARPACRLFKKKTGTNS